MVLIPNLLYCHVAGLWLNRLPRPLRRAAAPAQDALGEDLRQSLRLMAADLLRHAAQGTWRTGEKGSFTTVVVYGATLRW